MLHTIELTTRVEVSIFYALRREFGMQVFSASQKTDEFRNYGFREVQLNSNDINGMIIRLMVIRLNTKVLLDNQETLLSTQASETYRIATAFNERKSTIFGDFTSELPDFDQWTCRRIDYCVDVITEHVSAYVVLFQRCKLPSRHYNITIKKKGSSYMKSNSVTLNFYDKFDQLEKHLLALDKTMSNKEQNEATNMLRFEIQCQRGKTDYIKRREGFDTKSIEHFLDSSLSNKLILDYYDKSIGTGDFYSLHGARAIVDRANLQFRTKQTLLNTLKLIAQTRSIEKARVQFIAGVDIGGGTVVKGSRKTFNDNIKKIRLLGVNPVTIPRNWEIAFLPNPRGLILSRIQSELEETH
ncbi:hypothetical protein NSQ91_00985 [Paenibacillus sp. FSL R7-0048]|uniref:hypothetical protein n=1 Tax=Paenibacillus sp. FSL R7-0048 TaxID=2954528 RepID=UPI0030F91C1D